MESVKCRMYTVQHVTGLAALGSEDAKLQRRAWRNPFYLCLVIATIIYFIHTGYETTLRQRNSTCNLISKDLFTTLLYF